MLYRPLYRILNLNEQNVFRIGKGRFVSTPRIFEEYEIFTCARYFAHKSNVIRQNMLIRKFKRLE